MFEFCPDQCPTCGANLRADGYPTGHQHAATGDECTFRWDVEGAMQAELAAEAAEEYEARWSGEPNGNWPSVH